MGVIIVGMDVGPSARVLGACEESLRHFVGAHSQSIKTKTLSTLGGGWILPGGLSLLEYVLLQASYKEASNFLLSWDYMLGC